MKPWALCCLLFCSLEAFAQKSKTEAPYISYFEQNKDNLDPIEGIWNVSSVQEFYRYDTLYDVIDYPKAARMAVMKKDGKYLTFDLSGGDYQVEFSKTDVKGVYLYRNFFKETAEYSKAQAVISKAGEMEYTYDFPDNYLKLKFADSYEEGTRVTNRLLWTRTYPAHK